jgi:hypothetical protein
LQLLLGSPLLLPLEIGHLLLVLAVVEVSLEVLVVPPVWPVVQV